MNSTDPRYIRQQVLPEIGAAGQSGLSAAKVLLVGCGALGTTAADLLCRAGVGLLRIVDRDLVEPSNLQRQTLYDERDAAEGLPKAIAAARRFSSINSTNRVEPVVGDVNASNIQSLCDGIDLILDGTDNVATRYLLNDQSVKTQTPWIYAGCVGTGGRVMAVWPHKTACLRCLFPDPPKGNELPTCDVAGVLGPAAAVVGALQAALAIRMIVEGESCADKIAGMISLDAWTPRQRQMSAHDPDPNCPCCGARQFPFLEISGELTSTLCGRDAVQVRGTQVDLQTVAQKWSGVGTVRTSPWFVRCQLRDPPEMELTLFPDGRLLVKGTTDPKRARSVYARFVGG